jgi:hypothetical protein
VPGLFLCFWYRGRVNFVLFRDRLLSLLGLPAVGLCCTPRVAQGPSDTVIEIPTAVSSTTAQPQDDLEPITRKPRGPLASCPKDQVRAWMCGTPSTPSAACPGDAGGVYANIVLPSFMMLEPSARNDERLTKSYRAHFGSDQCCYSQCRPISVRRGGQPPPEGWVSSSSCMPAVTVTSLPAPGWPQCPAAVAMPYPMGEHVAGFDAEASARETESGHFFKSLDMEVCCYRSANYPMAVPGRPLRVDGEIVHAAWRPSQEWLLPCGATRRDATEGERWLRDAALEHASIAAFARLSLALLAHGAPADLLVDAHRAALDEIEHARLAYGMAAHHGVEARGPGALVIADHQPTSMTLAQLARETFIDGCMGELWASAIATREAESTDDPELARIHRRIADDEMRHAELAWRIVAWALSIDPSLAGGVSHELAAIRSNATDALHHAIVTEVVAPCAQSLVAATAPPATDAVPGSCAREGCAR